MKAIALDYSQGKKIAEVGGRGGISRLMVLEGKLYWSLSTEAVRRGSVWSESNMDLHWESVFRSSYRRVR